MFPQNYNVPNLSDTSNSGTTMNFPKPPGIFSMQNIQQKQSYVPPEFRVPIIQKKEVNFNWVNYVSLFFLVIFFIIIVVLLFVNTTTKSKFIKPENCPVVKADYASIPSVPLVSTQTINNCSGNPDGYQGNKACVFSNINSVFDAQALCNRYQTSICSGFGYDITTSTVNFINTSYSLTSSGSANSALLDVYIKQNA
jgi:hypothetical protein